MRAAFLSKWFLSVSFNLSVFFSISFDSNEAFSQFNRPIGRVDGKKSALLSVVVRFEFDEPELNAMTSLPNNATDTFQNSSPKALSDWFFALKHWKGKNHHTKNFGFFLGVLLICLFQQISKQSLVLFESWCDFFTLLRFSHHLSLKVIFIL